MWDCEHSIATFKEVMLRKKSANVVDPVKK